MPHVSPQQINEETLQKLYKIFFSTMTGRRGSQKQQQKLLSKLLTPTEQIMLGKRLAAIALLDRGVSTHQVGRALKLSRTTTGKLLDRLERGDYDDVIKAIRLHKKSALTHYLENLLFKPLPPYAKGRWKYFDE